MNNFGLITCNMIITDLIQDPDELVVIFVSSLKTAKKTYLKMSNLILIKF
jgi:hypothetical protein